MADTVITNSVINGWRLSERNVLAVNHMKPIILDMNYVCWLTSIPLLSDCYPKTRKFYKTILNFDESFRFCEKMFQEKVSRKSQSVFFIHPTTL